MWFSHGMPCPVSTCLMVQWLANSIAAHGIAKVAWLGIEWVSSLIQSDHRLWIEMATCLFQHEIFWWMGENDSATAKVTRNSADNFVYGPALAFLPLSQPQPLLLLLQEWATRTYFVLYLCREMRRQGDTWLSCLFFRSRMNELIDCVIRQRSAGFSRAIWVDPQVRGCSNDSLLLWGILSFVSCPIFLLRCG